MKHSETDDKEIMINDIADEDTEELFQSIFLDLKLGWKHQWKLVTLYVIVFIYCIKNVIKNVKFGGSYIDSPNWIKSKKCALNHKEIGKKSQGISKVDFL